MDHGNANVDKPTAFEKIPSKETMLYINKEAKQWTLKWKLIIIVIASSFILTLVWFMDHTVSSEHKGTIIEIPSASLSEFQLACTGTGRGLQSLRFTLKTGTLEGVCNNGLIMYYQLKTPNE